MYLISRYMSELIAMFLDKKNYLQKAVIPWINFFFFNEGMQYYIFYKILPFFSLALVSVWNEKF